MPAVVNEVTNSVELPAFYEWSWPDHPDDMNDSDARMRAGRRLPEHLTTRTRLEDAELAVAYGELLEGGQGRNPADGRERRRPAARNARPSPGGQAADGDRDRRGAERPRGRRVRHRAGGRNGRAGTSTGTLGSNRRALSRHLGAQREDAGHRRRGNPAQRGRTHQPAHESDRQLYGKRHRRLRGRVASRDRAGPQHRRPAERARRGDRARTEKRTDAGAAGRHRLLDKHRKGSSDRKRTDPDRQRNGRIVRSAVRPRARHAGRRLRRAAKRGRARNGRSGREHHHQPRNERLRSRVDTTRAGTAARSRAGAAARPVAAAGAGHPDRHRRESVLPAVAGTRADTKHRTHPGEARGHLRRAAADVRRAAPGMGKRAKRTRPPNHAGRAGRAADRDAEAGTPARGTANAASRRPPTRRRRTRPRAAEREPAGRRQNRTRAADREPDRDDAARAHRPPQPRQSPTRPAPLLHRLRTAAEGNRRSNRRRANRSPGRRRATRGPRTRKREPGAPFQNVARLGVEENTDATGSQRTDKQRRAAELFRVVLAGPPGFDDRQRRTHALRTRPSRTANARCAAPGDGPGRGVR